MRDRRRSSGVRRGTRRGARRRRRPGPADPVRCRSTCRLGERCGRRQPAALHHEHALADRSERRCHGCDRLHVGRLRSGPADGRARAPSVLRRTHRVHEPAVGDDAPGRPAGPGDRPASPSSSSTSTASRTSTTTWVTPPATHCCRGSAACSVRRCATATSSVASAATSSSWCATTSPASTRPSPWRPASSRRSTKASHHRRRHARWSARASGWRTPPIRPPRAIVWSPRPTRGCTSRSATGSNGPQPRSAPIGRRRCEPERPRSRWRCAARSRRETGDALPADRQLPDAEIVRPRSAGALAPRR